MSDYERCAHVPANMYMWTVLLLYAYSEQDLRSWPSSSLLELSKDLPSNPLSTCTKAGYRESHIVSNDTNMNNFGSHSIMLVL